MHMAPRSPRRNDLHSDGTSPFLSYNVRPPKRFGPDGMPLNGPDGPPKRFGPDGLPDEDLPSFSGLGEYGPDGERLERSGGPVKYGPDGMAKSVVETGRRHGVELEAQDELGWYQAESGRLEQEELAGRNFGAICRAVDELHQMGRCPSGRWTNDPAVFPDITFPGVVPFPPDDAQLYLPRLRSRQQGAQRPGEGPAAPEEQATIDDRRWARLVEYGAVSGAAGSSACCLFDNSDTHATHCGRVYQGQLDNAFLVEALNAISLRPKLARRLFYYADVERSVYVLRLFKNGTWVRVEIDDYVPAGPRSADLGDEALPFCCHSEHFPSVLWPSLVEKACAKACTMRSPDGVSDSGGWQALGGGGRVEEAFADLTGGIAGCFSTRDVAPDRLFVYLHELQRDCLFVCRPHLNNCMKRGALLNPFANYAVNRAAHHDGACYVQVLCAAGPHSGGGGMPHHDVPDALQRLFPEKSADGFFWLGIHDFHFYFDILIECRLTNSPDVGIAGMPPPRLPMAIVPSPQNGLPSGPFHAPPMPGAHPLQDQQAIFCEWVFANAGVVSEHCPPEFRVALPEFPCEIVAIVEQTDPRITQTGPNRKTHAAILLKVYECIGDDVYSSELVCKSNWIPVRSSMVAFRSSKGGVFKIIAEFERGVRCDRLIFRCYASWPSVNVSAGVSLHKHFLAKPVAPPLAVKWTFVGCMDPFKLARTDEPEPLDEDIDELRRQLSKAQQCTVM